MVGQGVGASSTTGAGPDVTRRTGGRSVGVGGRWVQCRCACVSLSVGVSQGEKLWLGGHELARFLLALRVVVRGCVPVRVCSVARFRETRVGQRTGRGLVVGWTAQSCPSSTNPIPQSSPLTSTC